MATYPSEGLGARGAADTSCPSGVGHTDMAMLKVKKTICDRKLKFALLFGCSGRHGFVQWNILQGTEEE